MNKNQIAETLRNEVGELEATIKKLQGRCERLKTFVLDLESELTVSEVPKPVMEGKFRKVIDQVFGENPKQPKH